MTTDTEPTHKEIADAAARYVALKAARFVVTSTGETFSADEMKRELDKLQAVLKPYIEENVELDLEDVGTLRLQPRSGGWSWDVKAMYEIDQLTFQRALDLNCITIDEKVLKAQEGAGAITAVRKWGFQQGGTPALIVEKKRQ